MANNFASIDNLISILDSESEIKINWFKDNRMIMNPSKSQALILDKHKGNQTNQIIIINHKEIKVVSKVKLLGIEIDNEPKVNHHISSIYSSVSNHLNTLIRLKHLLSFEERKVLGNTFAMLNFNYCCLVWNCCSAQSLNKIENLPERAFCFFLNDYGSTFEDLLEKFGYPNMNLRRERKHCA